MRLTIVGNTGSMSGPDGAASCYLVQVDGVDPKTGKNRTWSVVMDLGPGSFGQLWRYMNPRDLDALLITHGHADHMADIISMHVFLKWHPEGACSRLFTAGPAELVRRIVDIHGYASPAEIASDFDIRTVRPGTTLRVGPTTIAAYKANHPVEAYGFRIEGPSEEGDSTVTIAYTGDTDTCDGMIKMAHGVDLLLSECGFTDNDRAHGIHLSGTRAGQLAADGNVGQLVLTHIQPWTDVEVPLAEARAVYRGPLEVARPGQVYAV